MPNYKDSSTQNLHTLIKFSQPVDEMAKQEIKKVVGMIFRTANGNFILTGNNGLKIELPADTIEKIHVVDTSGAYPIIELTIQVSEKFHFINPG